MAKVCRNNKARKQHSCRYKPDIDRDSDSDDVFSVHIVKGSSEWLVDTMVDRRSVVMKVITGAEVSVMPKSVLQKVNLSN